jgi:hypothetical protein
MISIPSIGTTPVGGSSIAQFLHGISKKKSSTATPVAPGGAGSTSPGGQAGGTALISQIQQTVTNALQAAKANGSTQDPNQIVEDSIASLLKNVLTGKGQPPSSTPASQQAFQGALQSAGISQQQFQTDLKAAIQDAQNGQAHPLPTGTALDVTG